MTQNTRSSAARKEIRACVDLGSSYFRLLVLEGAFPDRELPGRAGADITGVREERRYVGWGEEVARSIEITPASVERARAALASLVAEARRLGCREPALVATNTLREARNAREVARLLERDAGAPLTVLSQSDEARLGYLGSAFLAAPDEEITLIDVGGTSTELSWGRGMEMAGWAGLPLGTHRALAVCGGRLYSRAALRRGRVELGRSIAELAPPRRDPLSVSPLPVPPEHSTILCTGGTAVSCVVLLRYMRGLRPLFEEMYPLTIGDVALAGRRLAGLAEAMRERTVPLDAHRMRLLPAGLVLMEALLERLRVGSFRVTARDLRWGILIAGGAIRRRVVAP